MPLQAFLLWLGIIIKTLIPFSQTNPPYQKSRKPCLQAQTEHLIPTPAIALFPDAALTT
jgi:hypothetical protein